LLKFSWERSPARLKKPLHPWPVHSGLILQNGGHPRPGQQGDLRLRLPSAQLGQKRKGHHHIAQPIGGANKNFMLRSLGFRWVIERSGCFFDQIFSPIGCRKIANPARWPQPPGRQIRSEGTAAGGQNANCRFLSG